MVKNSETLPSPTGFRFAWSALVGYDFFISYRRSDATPYAATLADLLRRADFRCFLDDNEAAPGTPLTDRIRRALSRSKKLVVVASPCVEQSSWVAEEVHIFAQTGRDIIPINIKGGLERAFQEGRKFAALKARDALWIDEAADVGPSGTPSAHVIGGLQKNFTLQRANRNLRMIGAAVAVAVILSLGVALWQFRSRLAAVDRERDQHVLASVARAYRVVQLDPLRAVDEARQALAVKRTAEGEQALRIAMEVGLRRREAREDESKILGSGEGYLMGRWRRGDVFTKLRTDGRYAVVATERGADGPNPPGTVYMISIDNLRTRELLPGDSAKGRRLEYMGFSSSGTEIFVTRQFYLDIYDLDGNRTKSVPLEFHAKPTHLIAGMFGSYVLVGDTEGHLMLADTLSDKRPQLEGGRYRDAALFMESNPAGTRAIVVFESGRAVLVVLDDPARPVEHDLGTTDTIHAAFAPPGASERFLTASRTGRIDVWQLSGSSPGKVSSLPHGKAAVGLASFSSDGMRVISLDKDGQYKVWDIGKTQPLSVYH